MDKRRSGIEKTHGNYFKRIDYWLIVPVLILTVIGLMVLNQVLMDKYPSQYPGNINRQIMAAGVGLVAALVICLLETHFLKIIGRAIYGISLLLLAVVPFDGTDYTQKWGADSWMELPLIGSFQPSEIAKVGLILMAAYVLEEMSERRISLPKGVLYLGFIYGPPCLLILMQPDFGTLMVIVFTLICMLFVWGLKYRYIFLGLSAVIVSIPFVWNFYLATYQKQRILSTLFRGSDPAAEYNIEQAQKAIASGGLTGNNSGVFVDVPVKESDFIFSAVSEQMGFIGTGAVIFLSFFFVARCFYIAARASTKAYSFIAAGIAGGFAFHFIENIGMTVGLLPITGIPLPFISLGGSSLIVNFISVGVVLSIAMDRSRET